jgi:hypothetical protein
MYSNVARYNRNVESSLSLSLSFFSLSQQAQMREKREEENGRNKNRRKSGQQVIKVVLPSHMNQVFRRFVGHPAWFGLELLGPTRKALTIAGFRLPGASSCSRRLNSSVTD